MTSPMADHVGLVEALPGGDEEHKVSLYRARGRVFVGDRDPETCMTAAIETVDDDRASSLLGVLAPS